MSYKRIQGELLKIGIKISASSIRRILLDNPGPWIKRTGWAKFMRAQASSIIACDLFTVESLTRKTLHVLFFIELNTRRVFIAGVTDGPASCAWTAQMARNIASTRTGRAVKVHTLVHDRDTRFGPVFDEVFRAEGIEILRTPWRTPQANGYAERFIRTVRSEVLNRIFILGPRHLERVVDIYVEHYNNERPHRGLELLTPAGNLSPPLSRAANGKVIRRDRLGGLIHEYRQQSAA